ncbi:MAG: DNA cytosine methyltransferase [Lachnospiraceae bacterium]|nr:DNA cytosine methyltransferase [Lachnospiraceae bacterium]
MIDGKLVVDNFAGGGGASTGIEMATGISVDIAINHDPEAIRMHKANHPSTKHYCESVWDVDPVEACNGHPVALAWFSPDCKHFSKAKGGTPVEKEIRGLAWVAVKWASSVKPDVIMLENVEEFQTWGPLRAKRDEKTGRVLVKDFSDRIDINQKKRKPRLRVAEPGEIVPFKLQAMEPDPKRKGKTFRKFIKSLKNLGYEVEYRELVAADYGAPTMRKRFFLIARCDGKPIVWPNPTHAPADSESVKAGLLKPYVGAYTQLDFSLPCPSIFDTAEEIKEKYGIRAVRPLAPKTMERIARGLKKFVLENPEPFIIQCNHGGERRSQDIRDPMPTITGKHGYGVVEPYLVQIGQTGFAADRSKDVREPLTTIVSKNEHCLIEPKLAPCVMCNNTNNVGASVESPLPTITTGNRNFVVAPTLIQYHSETANGEVRGQRLDEPIMTVDGTNRYGLVTSFLHKYYDGGYTGAGESVENPLPTVTSWDHNSLCAATMIQMNNNCYGRDITEPIPTITSGDGHFGEVRAFLIKYYGKGIGQDIEEPLDTVTSRDRFGLVTIEGVDYQIVDIGLRMLEPKELYGCQGFPDDYIIDHDYTGKTYPRSEQVRRCGNAVCPPIPAALVRANLPEMCRCKRTGNMKIETEQTGQLRFA